MNRKATSVLMMVFEILAVALVIYILTSTASALGKSETVQKKIAAEEIRMMVDTLAGVPGETLVKYPGNASKFTFILEQNSVAVFVKRESEHLWVVRKFFLPLGYKAEGVSEGKERICLEKKSKKILLRPCP